MTVLKPLWVGLTGGIASGKSAVAAEFARWGVPVIDADQLAREVVEPGEPALAAIVAHFGSTALEDGVLNRRWLRERVFSQPRDRQTLEAIMHPAIRAAQFERAKQAGGAYQIHVMPLLTETGSEALYDRVLVVDCLPEIQLQRLLQRDDITEQLARSMIAAQATRAERLAIADDVLDNSGGLREMPAKVAVFHQRYLALAEAAAAAQP